MNTKVYVLELLGDPQNSGGSVIFEVAGVSLDRSVLEKLKIEKDKWLIDYLGEEESLETVDDGAESFDDSDEESDDEDDGEEEDDKEYCLFNTDLDGRPSWHITEYDLL